MLQHVTHLDIRITKSIILFQFSSPIEVEESRTKTISALEETVHPLEATNKQKLNK